MGSKNPFWLRNRPRKNGKKRYWEAGNGNLLELSHDHKKIAALAVLSYPRMTQGEIAEKLGYTQPYVSRIMSTDLFREYCEKEFGEESRKLALETRERMQSVANLALDKMSEKISEEDTSKLDLAVLSRTAVDLTKALGYTTEKSPAPGNSSTTNIQQNFYQVDPEMLAKARERQRRRREEKEAEALLPLPAPEVA